MSNELRIEALQQDLGRLQECMWALLDLLEEKKLVSFAEVEDKINERISAAGDRRIDLKAAEWERRCAIGEAVKQDVVSHLTWVVLRAPRNSMCGPAGSIHGGDGLFGKSVGDEVKIGEREFVIERAYLPNTVVSAPASGRRYRLAQEAAKRKKAKRGGA